MFLSPADRMAPAPSTTWQVLELKDCHELSPEGGTHLQKLDDPGHHVCDDQLEIDDDLEIVPEQDQAIGRSFDNEERLVFHADHLGHTIRCVASALRRGRDSALGGICNCCFDQEIDNVLRSGWDVDLSPLLFLYQVGRSRQTSRVVLDQERPSLTSITILSLVSVPEKQ